MRSPFQLANKSKEGCRSLHFAWKWFSLPTNGLEVQLILVHCTSSLVGSKGRPRIVLLWDPRGGWPGCLWSPGGRFYKHRRRREFELQRWQKSSGLDGGHSRVTQWSSGSKNSQARAALQLHNWNRQPPLLQQSSKIDSRTGFWKTKGEKNWNQILKVSK